MLMLDASHLQRVGARRIVVDQLQAIAEGSQSGDDGRVRDRDCPDDC